MKLPMNQIIALRSVFHTSIDGYERVLTEGSRERVVRVHYSFSGVTRQLLMRNLGKLDQEALAFDKAERALMDELSKGTGTINMKTDPEAAQRFNSEQRKMLEAEVDIDLEMVDLDELRLDPPYSNQIPVTVLNALASIIRPLDSVTPAEA